MFVQHYIIFLCHMLSTIIKVFLVNVMYDGSENCMYVFIYIEKLSLIVYNYCHIECGLKFKCYRIKYLISFTLRQFAN